MTSRTTTTKTATKTGLVVLWPLVQSWGLRAMTTWCRPDIQQQQQQATVSERRCANKQQQQQQQRHSIADILGWTATSSSEVKVEGGVVMMASSFQDSDMMQMNDEPLDLSLDKSKCRAREREAAASAAAAAAAATTGIKRSKTKSVVVRDDLADDGDDDPLMNGVSGHDDREVDEDGEPEMWPSDMMVAGQPNQQQVAHLYMMMLAARLMQSNEAVRYQESQGRRGGEDGSSDDVGDDGPGSGNDPMAVATAAAAAAAAAAGLLGHHQLSGSGIDSIGGHPAAKRRKKDHVVMASDDPTANGARPRKTRTTFTGKQLFELERIFEQKKYLSSNERQEVARLLNVTGSQVSRHRLSLIYSSVLNRQKFRIL